ncbi:hypothetical protein [Coleofasciculus sp. FACHB-129]|uniref:hypothetical protein n=1 Tax=Cyanophyceae TaxID=3028117 RepID=UPI0016841ABF|nr:hypothetical protein [Coleofasciculus sp. FACHB-129]MBD1893921.1 hypothetical protein [Coleofasciculus sp. FACHB-129]
MSAIAILIKVSLLLDEAGIAIALTFYLDEAGIAIALTFYLTQIYTIQQKGERGSMCDRTPHTNKRDRIGCY